MSSKLGDWLKGQSSTLCAATLHRAPNMLPDDEDVNEFLVMLAEYVGLPLDEQLSAVQSWALTTIGRDAYTAGDWLTILRVMKEEISNALGDHFSPEMTLAYTRQTDYLLTNAIIEAAQLTSYMGQVDLLEHTVQLREELERLEESKSNFIAVAAHELRTPLTIVEGYANILRVETAADSPLRLYINGMENGLFRMQQIIMDMIDVSLLDLQSFELNYQEVYLEKIVEAVCENLEKHFEQRRVGLFIEPFAEKRTTYADPQKLAKALDKVILNALKYTPDGGRVTIRCILSEADEPVGDIAGYLDIEITDTGIGIDPPDLERIFDRFSSIADWRHHSSSKTAFKGGGAGLGLPIAKGIVEAHGGQIWAESAGFDEAACPGSTFHIELPMYINPPVSVEGSS